MPDVSIGTGQGLTEAQRGAAEVLDQGYTVLPDLLEPDLVEQVRVAFMPLLERHVAAAPTNRGVNRYQMYVPFEPPFNSLDLIANPRVLAIVDLVLGADAECTYLASDTPLPGADYQHGHMDSTVLFPGFDAPLPPYALGFNVPLVDVDADNGPLECWPGGEHSAAAEADPPLRLTVPAGTGVVRDTRMWHRGSPNRSDAPRPMLALLYNRPWYRFALDRPTITRDRFEALPEAVRRRFGGATIVA